MDQSEMQLATARDRARSPSSSEGGGTERECEGGKRDRREPGSSIDRLLSSSIPATEP